MLTGPREKRRSAGADGDAVDVSGFGQVVLARGSCYELLRRSKGSGASREK
jgi:hypothetical protein